MFKREFKPGDWVIYRVSKRSSNPGPRAQRIEPSRSGEGYSYQVDKYWIVQSVEPNARLIIRTRRGKTHELDQADPLLRHARWWEKLFLARRFPETPAQDAEQPAE